MAENEVTALLSRLASGDEGAAEPLYARVYAELRALAGRHMARERPGHTLGATALAHEAYLRLVGQAQAEFANRNHFMAVAALAMRRILINHARDRIADKRGAGAPMATFDEDWMGQQVRAADLVALDEALDALAKDNPRAAKVVLYRFFVGLSHDEIAELMSLSEPTVRRDWRFARAWLVRAMGSASPGEPS